ncbi:MAG: hypothetical protein WCY11_06065 [Novosphingobium sp.]
MASPLPFSLGDPRWLAHRLVEGSDAARFLWLPREDHASVPFLTDACLGQRPLADDVALAECLKLPDAGGLHFLFHSAFCASTLLTRALDRPGVSMGLSEPVILNDVVGLRRRGADPRAVARAADAATRLLARPFGPGEAVVVKPSNILNPLAELLMALRPHARAIFLHAPLETFLISVARKGLGCRFWVRELLEGYLRDGAIDLGFAPEDYFRQTDLQVAAVGWLAQHRIFFRLAEKLGPQRLASLDADRLAADPHTAILAVAGHLGLTLDDTAAAEIVAGPAFHRHSKSGEAFTPATRSASYSTAHAAHEAEIGAVMEWARAVAASAAVPLAAPYPLLP